MRFELARMLASMAAFLIRRALIRCNCSVRALTLRELQRELQKMAQLANIFSEISSILALIVSSASANAFAWSLLIRARLCSRLCLAFIHPVKSAAANVRLNGLITDCFPHFLCQFGSFVLLGASRAILVRLSLKFGSLLLV